MKPLPLTVVAGYLGAGKTTFINRLLAGDHGLRLMVLVNDFGAINIDATLMASTTEDTIALTNGCVCCTMGADLFMALGDALDRRPRPDHLIVEASGIADPARIANAGLAEPDLTYAGILTIVDGQQIEALAKDALIGPQIRAQITCADMVMVSKRDTIPKILADLTHASVVLATSAPDPSALLFATPSVAMVNAAPHPAYQGWSYSGAASLVHDTLRATIAARPKALFRLKGIIRDHTGAAWEVHAVGQHITVTPHTGPAETQIVAIGLAELVALRDVDAWWDAATG